LTLIFCTATIISNEIHRQGRKGREGKSIAADLADGREIKQGFQERFAEDGV
jgi:hypothetical protein